MVFSSLIFLCAFLPIVWLVNRYLPGRVSNYFLCVASLIFYAWGEPVYVLLMIACVLMNFLIARNMHSSERKKLRLAVAVVLNLLTLVFFKYTDFFIGTINSVFGANLSLLQIPLPIGISFFTFQAMSYTIDVYREHEKPQQSLMNVLLYVSFFPQLIAGPIIKYYDVAEQITTRHIDNDKTAQGIRRFIVGLSKKVLIANTIGVAVDAIFLMDSQTLAMPTAWIAAVGYALQLYFDFSGYSDMALGLGNMFGFTFPENFQYPYIASGMQDFWRRWHISLSTWFKEYVYIPLGGNRRSKKRTLLNKSAVFFLTGLWHGAEWTFVLWGLLHGFFMILEDIGIIPTKKLGSKTRWLGTLYAVFVAMMTFVIFRASSLQHALDLWRAMFVGSPSMGAQSAVVTTPLLWAIGIGIVGSTPWLLWVKKKSAQLSRPQSFLSTAGYIVTVALLFFCLLTLSSSTHNPFIYFRF